MTTMEMRFPVGMGQNTENKANLPLPWDIKKLNAFGFRGGESWLMAIRRWI